MKTGDDQARSSLSDKQSPSPCPSISPQRLTSMHLPESSNSHAKFAAPTAKEKGLELL